MARADLSATVNLHIKVVGEGSNVQLVRLDPDGKATTARPGTAEELWMYGVLQRQFGVIAHLEDQHAKDAEVIDRLTTELEWTRGVANTAEENLYTAQQKIANLEAESTTWKTRLVDETARLREHLAVARGTEKGQDNG